jgi:hypothetical protein
MKVSLFLVAVALAVASADFTLNSKNEKLRQLLTGAKVYPIGCYVCMNAVTYARTKMPITRGQLINLMQNEFCLHYQNSAYMGACFVFVQRLLRANNVAFRNIEKATMDPSVVCDRAGQCDTSSVTSVKCVVSTHMIDTSLTQCGVSVNTMRSLLQRFECPHFGKYYKDVCTGMAHPSDDFVKQMHPYVDCTCNGRKASCNRLKKNLCRNDGLGNCASGYSIATQLGYCSEA